MEIVGSEIFWNGMATGFSGEQRVSPIWMIRNTGDGYDGTDGCLGYFYLVQTVKLIELADLDLL